MYSIHDVEYFLTLLKMNSREYVLEILDPLYRKSIPTLQSLSRELNLVHHTERMIAKAK